jgi:hypothetical protein
MTKLARSRSSQLALTIAVVYVCSGLRKDLRWSILVGKTPKEQATIS